MITHYPLSWWVERVKQPLSLARFGDGEFLCIERKKGGNSHGCAYTPELREDLYDVLKAPILKGMQRILPFQHRRIRHLLQGDWVDTEIFADSIQDGTIGQFLDALREKPLVIISSKEKEGLARDWGAGFIEVPRTNAHAEKEHVLEAIKILGIPATYLFACGMAAGTFVAALDGTIPEASFIDIGHILDPLCGELSRDYMLHD